MPLLLCITRANVSPNYGEAEALGVDVALVSLAKPDAMA